MNSMRQLPIGIQDFKSIRNSNKYFVDKSMLIAQMLEQNDEGAFLYTRPRRFGKSLNLSMIDAFFNIEYKDNKWFDELEISKYSEFNVYKNAFPVIMVDMRVDAIKNFDDFIEAWNSKMFDVFGQFLYLEKSTILHDKEKQLFDSLYSSNNTERELKNALLKLCMMLKKHHDSNVIVLLDEYDNAVNSVTDPTLRKEIVDFLKGMMSPLLKGNSSLQFGVITGVMQITKENIFSGLNNLFVNNILDRNFDEMFGFTDDEVKQICVDYGHPEKFEEAKDWYDGYRFGDADIYNPWSILNYIQGNFTPKPYWVNTSNNNIIDDMISNADEEMLENLRILGSGGSLNIEISTELTFQDLETNRNAIYSLMAATGYLKVTTEGWNTLVSIPNRELYSEFARIVNNAVYRNGGSSTNMKAFTGSILTADVETIEKTLYNLIADVLSSRVLGDEHAYQGFIVGMLMSLSGRYEITADFESGKGYYDIRMKKKRGAGCNVIMELKRTDNESSLESEAKKALEQIRDRDYAHGLEGKTLLYGISFCGKVPFVLSDQL